MRLSPATRQKLSEDRKLDRINIISKAISHRVHRDRREKILDRINRIDRIFCACGETALKPVAG